jgi:hypothetical protein
MKIELDRSVNTQNDVNDRMAADNYALLSILVDKGITTFREFESKRAVAMSQIDQVLAEKAGE